MTKQQQLRKKNFKTTLNPFLFVIISHPSLLSLEHFKAAFISCVFSRSPQIEQRYHGALPRSALGEVSVSPLRSITPCKASRASTTLDCLVMRSYPKHLPDRCQEWDRSQTRRRPKQAPPRLSLWLWAAHVPCIFSKISMSSS